MENDKSKVRWQDGTYDRSRRCDSCGSHVCPHPIHSDQYKEIGNVKDPALNYWDWMDKVSPCGGELSVLGEFIHNELYNANPDGLAGEGIYSSGISEKAHKLAQEAFNQLSPRQQEVWDLVMRQQIPQVEVAKKLQISPININALLKRAKASFTNYLRSKQDVATKGVSEL